MRTHYMFSLKNENISTVCIIWNYEFLTKLFTLTDCYCLDIATDQSGYTHNIYTPDIRSMWGYIVFAFPFIRSYVRSFVRWSFRHRVKVFALKFIRPHILKTL